MDEAEKLPHCLPVKRCDDYDVAKAKAGDFSEMTAEQYLSFVRDQADNMPVVARADIDITQFEGRQTKYMPEISSILPCDEDLLPLSDWEQSVLNDFENLRANVQGKMDSRKRLPRTIVVPAMKDERSWFTICSEKGEEFVQEGMGKNDAIGDDGSDDINNDDEKVEEDRDQLDKNHIGILEAEGTVASLLSSENELSNKKRKVEEECEGIAKAKVEVVREASEESHESMAILQSPFLTLREWREPMDPTLTLLLQFDSVLTQKLLAFNVSWVERQSHISNCRCCWIFALLARLETPLYQDTVAVLRQLYRICCSLRSQLSNLGIEGLQDQGGDNWDDNVMLTRLNLLIVLTGSYYGQGDDYRTRK